MWDIPLKPQRAHNFSSNRWFEIIKWFVWCKIPMKWRDNIQFDFFGASFLHFGCFTAWNAVIHTVIFAFFLNLNILILREICKRRHSPRIDTLALLISVIFLPWHFDPNIHSWNGNFKIVYSSIFCSCTLILFLLLYYFTLVLVYSCTNVL